MDLTWKILRGETILSTVTINRNDMRERGFSILAKEFIAKPSAAVGRKFPWSNSLDEIK